jgi:hypothetical protein
MITGKTGLWDFRNFCSAKRLTGTKLIHESSQKTYNFGLPEGMPVAKAQ